MRLSICLSSGLEYDVAHKLAMRQADVRVVMLPLTRTEAVLCRVLGIVQLGPWRRRRRRRRIMSQDGGQKHNKLEKQVLLERAPRLSFGPWFEDATLALKLPVLLRTKHQARRSSPAHSWLLKPK
jgi:hypothetical protein